jgi:transcriptional regulator with XRE-family HTH domain
MDRYEQRRRKLLQNPEVAAGYREMGVELELMQALDAIRKQQHMSQEQLAARIGKKREAISRLFSADDINPTLNTLIELLSALNLTADITIRQAEEGEDPIKVAVELTPSQ